MAVTDLPPTVEDPTVGKRNQSTREPWVLVQSPHPRGTIAGVLLSLLPGDSKSPHFSLLHGRQRVASLSRGPHAQRCWQLRREAGLRGSVARAVWAEREPRGPHDTATGN